jgi:hypothetical protein
VGAAVHEALYPCPNALGNPVLDPILAVVRQVMEAEPGLDHGSLAAQSVRENAKDAAASLLRGSVLLRELQAQGGLAVVCAEYSLETGKVEFSAPVT